MKIVKMVQGHKFEFDLMIIKEYPHFTLYNVIKYIDGKAVSVFKEAYTPLQLKDIANYMEV